MNETARTAPEYLKKAVMYQIFLRPFTPEGTLNSASELLPHLANLGVDILYLCPVAEADDDPRLEFWSPRQKRSGLNNPKNPYRIKDYFKIDPEYGDNEALKNFVQKSHALGMRVILDLVYYHCGPAPAFLDEHPDFVRRNEKGEIRNGEWLFPELNFDNPELREYLWKNMEYFVQSFNIDGYRCDVAGAVPLDFWETGRRRLERIKPDILMLAESVKREEQRYAFDLNYQFEWYLYSIFAGTKTAEAMEESWRSHHELFLPGARGIRHTENHDIVNELGTERCDNSIGIQGHNAMFVINFMLDGVPFLYNGQEIADNACHSIWGNRDHGHNLQINWSRALTPEGRNRFKLLQKLTELRHSEPVLTEGTVRWLKHDRKDAVSAFLRQTPDETLLVIVNCRSQPVAVTMENPVGKSAASTEELLNSGAKVAIGRESISAELLSYGWIAVKY